MPCRARSSKGHETDASEPPAQPQALTVSVRPELPSMESNRFGEKTGQPMLSVFQAAWGRNRMPRTVHPTGRS